VFVDRDSGGELNDPWKNGLFSASAGMHKYLSVPSSDAWILVVLG
jgi:hypothetical protein